MRWLLVLCAACGGGDDATTGPIVLAAQLPGDASRELYSINEDGSGLTALTSSGEENEFAPRWSPDGTRISFLIDAQLFVMDLEGTRTMVAPQVGRGDQGLTAAAWSPDGERLLYPFPREPAFNDLGEDISFSTLLHVVDDDGSNDAEFLPEVSGSLAYPAWAPNGRIAFSKSSDCPDCAGDVVLALTRNDGRLHEIELTGGRADADWSPDSATLVGTSIVEFDTSASWALVRIDPSEEELTTLLIPFRQEGARPMFPRWSPNGRRIAYVGPNGLHVVNADGSGKRRILEATDIAGMDW